MTSIPSHEPNEKRAVLGRSVSLREAAEALSVSVRTIYNWIRVGRLETIRTLGGSQRVITESLHRCGRRLKPRGAVGDDGHERPMDLRAVADGARCAVQRPIPELPDRRLS